jgi:hypothetical protein
MSRRNVSQAEDSGSLAERIVVSDYVRLCLCEGLKPSDAFKEATRKLRALLKTAKLAGLE